MSATPAVLGGGSHQLSARQRANCLAALITEVFPTFLRRPIFTQLWLHLYGESWVDGRDSGAKVLFGFHPKWQEIGTAIVNRNLKKITVDGQDLRFQYDGTAGDSCTRVQRLVWRYGQVEINGERCWVDSSFRVSFKRATKRTTFAVESAVQCRRCDDRRVTVRGQRRCFFDRQIKPSFSTDQRRALADGIPDDWEIGLLLWLLLNSAHDGVADGNATCSRDDRDDDSSGGSGGGRRANAPPTGLLGGLAVKTVLTDKAAAHLRELRVNCENARKVRNRLHAHRTEWAATAEELSDCVSVLKSVLKEVVCLGTELGWDAHNDASVNSSSGWPGRGLLQQFHDEVDDTLMLAQTNVLDEDALKPPDIRPEGDWCPCTTRHSHFARSAVAVLALVAVFVLMLGCGWLGALIPQSSGVPAPFVLPPRNPQFVGRTRELQQLRSIFFSDGGHDADTCGTAAVGEIGRPTIMVTESSGSNVDPPHAQVVCLRGISGVGKTSLAVQFAHNATAEHLFPGGALMVRAGTRDQLHGSIAEMFGRGVDWPAGLGGLQTPASDSWAWPALRAILAKQCERDRTWLMVFDNADDETSFVLSSTLVWGDLVRSAELKCGRVLVTTRSCQHFVNVYHLDVDAVPKPVAREMLLRYSRDRGGDAAVVVAASSTSATETLSLTDSTTVAVDRLVDRLQGMPFALALAGSYVRRTQCAFEDYLNRLVHQPIEMLEHASDSSVHVGQLLELAGFDNHDVRTPDYRTALEKAGFVKLLDFLRVPEIELPAVLLAAGVSDAGHVRQLVRAVGRFVDRRRSISTTWRMTVYQLSVFASAVLNAWSLLVPDCLPADAVLHAALNHYLISADAVQRNITETEMEQAIEELCAWSLVKRRMSADDSRRGVNLGGVSTFGMHRLVQLHTREMMTAQTWALTVTAMARALLSLVDSWHRHQWVNASMYRLAFIPHALEVISVASSDTRCTDAAAGAICELCVGLARVLDQAQQRSALALQLLTDTALPLASRHTVGAETKAVILHRLCDLQRSAGRLKDALQSGERAVALLRNRSNDSVGAGIDPVRDSMCAGTLPCQVTRAVTLEASIMASIARVNMDLGRCARAQVVVRELLMNWSSVPSVLTPNPFGGEWKEVLRADFLSACATFAEAFDDVARSELSAAKSDGSLGVAAIDRMVRSGALAKHAGKTRSALTFYRKALQMARSLYAPDGDWHPMVIERHLDIAHLLMAARQWDVAAARSEVALEMVAKLEDHGLGDDPVVAKVHEAVALSAGGLWNTLTANEHFDLAVAALRQQHGGADARHPDLARVLAHQGALPQQDGDRAARLLQESVDMYASFPLFKEKRDPTFAFALLNLCYSLLRRQQHANATACFERVNCSVITQRSALNPWMVGDLYALGEDLMGAAPPNQPLALQLWTCAVAFNIDETESALGNRIFDHAADMVRKGAVDDGVDIFEALLKTNQPKLNFERLHGISHLFFTQHEFDRMPAVLHRALKIAQDYRLPCENVVETSLELAAAHFVLGDVHRACAVWQGHCRGRLNLKSVGFAVAAAVFAGVCGRWAPAEEALARAVAEEALARVEEALARALAVAGDHFRFPVMLMAPGNETFAAPAMIHPVLKNMHGLFNTSSSLEVRWLDNTSHSPPIVIEKPTGRLPLLSELVSHARWDFTPAKGQRCSVAEHVSMQYWCAHKDGCVDFRNGRWTLFEDERASLMTVERTIVDSDVVEGVVPSRECGQPNLDHALGIVSIRAGEHTAALAHFETELHSLRCLHNETLRAWAPLAVAWQNVGAALYHGHELGKASVFWERAAHAFFDLQAAAALSNTDREQLIAWLVKSICCAMRVRVESRTCIFAGSLHNLKRKVLELLHQLPVSPTVEGWYLELVQDRVQVPNVWLDEWLHRFHHYNWSTVPHNKLRSLVRVLEREAVALPVNNSECVYDEQIVRASRTASECALRRRLPYALHNLAICRLGHGDAAKAAQLLDESLNTSMADANEAAFASTLSDLNKLCCTSNTTACWHLYWKWVSTPAFPVNLTMEFDPASAFRRVWQHFWIFTKRVAFRQTASTTVGPQSLESLKFEPPPQRALKLSILARATNGTLQFALSLDNRSEIIRL